MRSLGPRLIQNPGVEHKYHLEVCMYAHASRRSDSFPPGYFSAVAVRMMLRGESSGLACSKFLLLSTSLPFLAGNSFVFLMKSLNMANLCRDCLKRLEYRGAWLYITSSTVRTL